MLSLVNFFKTKTLPGPHHVNEVQWIHDWLRSKAKGCMVDVGAHFGESSKPFVDLDWSVIAFEPDTSMSKQQAIRQTLGDKATIFTCALSDIERGIAPFYASSVSSGISGLLRFHESHVETGFVQVRALRRVLADIGVSHVDFLKIDTEGNDLLVLKGLDWSPKPEVIVCEFEDAKTRLAGYDYHALGDYLVKGGYRVFVSEWYPIKRYGMKHSWRRLCSFPCQLVASKAWGNFIAVPPERSDEFLRVAKRYGVSLDR